MLDNIIIRRIVGILVLPFLYARYSFILFLPLFFIEHTNGEVLLLVWSIYAIFFGFVMGNFGVMKHWTKLFKRILKVEYEIKGHYKPDILHSFNVWSYPILCVRDKEYNFIISKMGGNLYDEDDNIRRKAIILWLFS